MGVNTGKRILITGSQGFLGRKLVRSLRSKGYIVEEFDLHVGDISTFTFDFDQLDHVVHLASLVFVPASWEKPVAFYQTNVLGTINILELCRKMKCSLTYLSSYVYGSPQYLPVDENHPIHPASPYNHSKLLAENACSYFASTFDIPVTVFRPVNVYGPDQNPDFLIPKIIRQVFDPACEVIEVMDLRPKRDFLFIDDLIMAINRSIELERSGIYNVGSGYSIDVESIVKSILEASGVKKPYRSVNSERQNEIWDVYVDISKAAAELKWFPKTDFKQGIQQCVDEYKASKL
jgi:nucleoside-diphosphate-sugar epimerase